MQHLKILVLLVPFVVGAVGIGNLPVEETSYSLGDREWNLKYHNDVWNGGIFIYSFTEPFTPGHDSTIGFATYFILSQFGINYAVMATQVDFVFLLEEVAFNQPFRLFIWRDNGYLKPASNQAGLYADSSATLPQSDGWASYPVSTAMLPETIWVSNCYDFVDTTFYWAFAKDNYIEDDHSYINVTGLQPYWQPMANIGQGKAFLVTLTVEYTGIKENENEVSNLVLTKFPTITNGYLNIGFKLTNKEDVEIVIYDATGKVVSREDKTFNTGNHTISCDLSNCAAGNYFMKITHGNKHTLTKFVIVH